MSIGLRGGYFYELAEEQYLDWAEADPETRAHKVLWWLPLFSNVAGRYLWHPQLDTFVHKFYEYPRVLTELADRLKPKFLYRSARDVHGPTIICLEAWTRSGNTKMRDWAKSVLASLHLEIKPELIDDQERVFGF